MVRSFMLKMQILFSRNYFSVSQRFKLFNPNTFTVNLLYV